MACAVNCGVEDESDDENAIGDFAWHPIPEPLKDVGVLESFLAADAWLEGEKPPGAQGRRMVLKALQARVTN